MSQYAQYSLMSGKLRRLGRPLYRRPWLMLLLMVFFVGLGAGGVIYVYRDLLVVKDNYIFLVNPNIYKITSAAKALEMPPNVALDAFDVYVSPEQLELIFNTSFADVRLPPDKRDAYLKAVSKWSAYYSMPPLLVLSMIWRESTFDETTVSHANARGPMQVIYRYHKEKLARLGKGEADLHDIDVGVHIGVEILREYFDRYKRDIFRALTAYVGGQHSTYAPDIMRRYFNARIFLEEHFKNIATVSETAAGLAAKRVQTDLKKTASNKASSEVTKPEVAKPEATKRVPAEIEKPVVRRMINPAPVNSLQ